MTDRPIDPTTQARLGAVSTATLATVLFKRGLRNQFVQGARRLGAGKRPNMVGRAFTLRYIPAREDLDVLEGYRDPEHPQRKAIESVPPGQILVIDCRGDPRAASAGGILMTRLHVRGCAGVVTDGGLRDVEEIGGLAMPAYCAGPSAPTTLTRHHAVDMQLPIGCGEVAVFPGDVLVGDGDGVIVVPQEIADEVAAEAAEQESLETFVLEQVAGGSALPGTYPPNDDTRARYAAWRAKRED